LLKQYSLSNNLHNFSHITRTYKTLTCIFNRKELLPATKVGKNSKTVSTSPLIHKMYAYYRTLFDNRKKTLKDNAPHPGTAEVQRQHTPNT